MLSHTKCSPTRGTKNDGILFRLVSADSAMAEKKIAIVFRKQKIGKRVSKFVVWLWVVGKC